MKTLDYSAHFAGQWSHWFSQPFTENFPRSRRKKGLKRQAIEYLSYGDASPSWLRRMIQEEYLSAVTVMCPDHPRNPCPPPKNRPQSSRTSLLSPNNNISYYAVCYCPLLLLVIKFAVKYLFQNVMKYLTIKYFLFFFKILRQYSFILPKQVSINFPANFIIL